MNGKHRHCIYVSMPLCRVQRGHQDQRDQTDLVEMLYVIVLSRGTASQVCCWLQGFPGDRGSRGTQGQKGELVRVCVCVSTNKCHCPWLSCYCGDGRVLLDNKVKMVQLVILVPR